MRFLSILLLASGTVAANPYITASQVYLNGQGPFRFLIDTGAQSSMVTERLARTLGLTPQYRVEQVTATGSALIGAAIVHQIAIGSVGVEDAEVLIGGALPGVDGVIGQTFLSRLNYILDYKSRALLIEPDATMLKGDSIPFDVLNGLPAVEGEVSGRQRRLILDSGSPALVLFDAAPVTAGFASSFVQTNTGSATATVGLERLRLADGRVRRVPSVYLPGPAPDRRSTGLLPTSVFRWVYVNNTDKFVMFSAK